MARSRRPRAVEVSGAPNTILTSSGVRNAGSRRWRRGVEISTSGFTETLPSRYRNRKKVRTADSGRAIALRAYRRLRLATYRRASGGVTCAQAVIPWSCTNLANWARSRPYATRVCGEAPRSPSRERRKPATSGSEPGAAGALSIRRVFVGGRDCRAAMSGPAACRPRWASLRRGAVLCRRARFVGSGRHDLGVSAGLVQAPQRRAARGLMRPQDRRLATRAEAVGGPVPAGERARRVGAASEKAPAPPRAAFHHLADFAARAGDADAQRPSIPALRIAGAGDEFAKPAELAHQRAAALPAGFADFHDRGLDLHDLLLGGHQVVLKWRPEISHHLLPVQAALFDVVQFLFHRGGKVVVHHVAEVFDQQIVDQLAQIGGMQPAVDGLHISAALDRFNRGGIGAGPADPAFLQRPDQRRFRVARRRLGEMLLRVEGDHLERLAGRQVWQPALLSLAILRKIAVDGQETGKLDARPRGAELVRAGGDVHGERVHDGGGHLAAQEAFPDQFVDFELVAAQVRFHPVGRPLHGGGADGLMRVLR